MGQYYKTLDPVGQVYDVSDLVSGMYLIKVMNADGTTRSLRLVKN